MSYHSVRPCIRRAAAPLLIFLSPRREPVSDSRSGLRSVPERERLMDLWLVPVTRPDRASDFPTARVGRAALPLSRAVRPADCSQNRNRCRCMAEACRQVLSRLSCQSEYLSRPDYLKFSRQFRHCPLPPSPHPVRQAGNHFCRGT